MTGLDNPETYLRLDPGDMRARIRELPSECVAAWRQGLDFELPADYADVNRVVVLGMGGSAIGADLLRGLNEPGGKADVSVNRDYDPPDLDTSTLVVASSYSGNTEETLSAFAQALPTPAKKLALTTGGRLKALAEVNGVPVFTITYDAQPRAALPYSLFPLLAICQNLGIMGDASSDVEEMASTLQGLQAMLDDRSPTPVNPAKQMAGKLRGRLAVIYGAGSLSAVARRWKTQINENSKAWAFSESFPELNHNAVVGYEFPADLAHHMFVVLLRSQRLHERSLVRYRVTSELLSRAGIDHETVDASGESALSQMMSLVLFGDWASYYLALLNETDPTPVKAIDFLKRRIAEG